MDERSSPVDLEIARLAARQYGVVAWRQLIGLGLGRGAIAKRIAHGRLHPLHEGVYAVGHPLLSRSGRWMAAVLAFGPGAVLSHRTAAEVWCILPPTALAAHVTSAARSLRGRPGIVLHRVRSLSPDLTTEVDGLPVTSVPRTLLDLAGARETQPLRRGWDEAQRRGLLDVRAVEDLCDRSPGRRVRPLRALIADARDAPDSRRELEARFADLLAREDLPRPALNALVAGHVVDAVWHDQRLVVELDGRAYHSHDAAFENDRLRDVHLALAGYRVIRITWKRLTRQPGEVAAQLRGLLALPVA